jgi:hypothetical protein
MRSIQSRLLIFLLFLVLGFPVYAAEGEGLPNYTATPSATLTPTPSDQSEIESTSSDLCQALKVVRSGRYVPATVTFQTDAEVDNNKERFRYHFGDGVIQVDDNETQHTYLEPGDYEAWVEILNNGTWLTSDGCKTQVSVGAVPLVPHRASCQEIVILEGDRSSAPAEAVLLIRGRDNKAKIQGYRVDFGDGVVEEFTENRMTHRYVQAGTYQIKAQVMDSQGQWVEEGGTCRKRIHVLTSVGGKGGQGDGERMAMVKQPETGPPTWIRLASLILLGTGLLVIKVAAAKVDG